MKKILFIIITLCCAGLTSPIVSAQSLDVKSNMNLLNENIKKSEITDTYSIAVLGDNRSGDVVYRSILNDIKKRKPLFIVHLGDKSVTGKEKDYLRFVKLHEDMTIPFFSAAGNHDIISISPQTYIQRYGSPDFDFSIEDNAYIFIDSSDKKISNSTLSYLERALKKYKNKKVFLFTHCPTFDPIASHTLNPESIPLINALMDKYKVRYVFFGHNHIYAHRAINGRDEYISGGAGSPLYATDTSVGYYHYIWITIARDKVSIDIVKYAD